MILIGQSHSKYTRSMIECALSEGVTPLIVVLFDMSFKERIRAFRKLIKDWGVFSSVLFNLKMWARVYFTKTQSTYFENLSKNRSLTLVNVNSWSDTEMIVSKFHQDEIVFLAHSKVVPKATLEAWGRLVFNIHPGRLPDYRGVDTTRWMLANLESPCVSLHYVNSKIDGGQLIKLREIDISDCENFSEVEVKVFESSLLLFKEMIRLQRDKQFDLQNTYIDFPLPPLFRLMNPTKRRNLDSNFQFIKNGILNKRVHDDS